MQSSLSNYFICEMNVPLFIQHYAANGYCICIEHFIFQDDSLSYCTQYFTYVLLLWLGVLTLWKANIYQAIFMLSASEYVFPILIGILIAVRIKAECYG